MFYISIVCTWTKSEMRITDLADLSENCSRKGGASDESAKSVITKNKTWLLVKNTWHLVNKAYVRGCGATARRHSLLSLSCFNKYHVYLSKNMSSCLLV